MSDAVAAVLLRRCRHCGLDRVDLLALADEIPCTITRALSRSPLTHMSSLTHMMVCSSSMMPTGAKPTVPSSVAVRGAMESRLRKAALRRGQDFGAAVGLE